MYGLILMVVFSQFQTTVSMKRIIVTTFFLVVMATLAGKQAIKELDRHCIAGLATSCTSDFCVL